MASDQFLNTDLFRPLPPGTISSAKYNGFKSSLSGLPFVRPKYSCPKLLHDSSGLPDVKDRLLSCASKSLPLATCKVVLKSILAL